MEIKREIVHTTVLISMSSEKNKNKEKLKLNSSSVPANKHLSIHLKPASKSLQNQQSDVLHSIPVAPENKVFCFISCHLTQTLQNSTRLPSSTRKGLYCGNLKAKQSLLLNLTHLVVCFTYKLSQLRL